MGGRDALKGIIAERERHLMEALDATAKLDGVDKRAVALARTNIEQGFMWLVKSIANVNENA